MPSTSLPAPMPFCPPTLVRGLRCNPVVTFRDSTGLFSDLSYPWFYPNQIPGVIDRIFPVHFKAYTTRSVPTSSLASFVAFLESHDIQPSSRLNYLRYSVLIGFIFRGVYLSCTALRYQIERSHLSEIKKRVAAFVVMALPLVLAEFYFGATWGYYVASGLSAVAALLPITPMFISNKGYLGKKMAALEPGILRCVGKKEDGYLIKTWVQLRNGCNKLGLIVRARQFQVRSFLLQNAIVLFASTALHMLFLRSPLVPAFQSKLTHWSIPDALPKSALFSKCSVDDFVCYSLRNDPSSYFPTPLDIFVRECAGVLGSMATDAIFILLSKRNIVRDLREPIGSMRCFTRPRA